MEGVALQFLIVLFFPPLPLPPPPPLLCLTLFLFPDPDPELEEEFELLDPLLAREERDVLNRIKQTKTRIEMMHTVTPATIKVLPINEVSREPSFAPDPDPTACW